MATYLETESGESFKLEKVDLKDLDEFQELMDRVAARLAVKGHQAWHDYLGPEGPKLLRSRFEEGEVYLSRINHLAVAGITLQTHNHVWKTDKDRPALWVHILARDPDMGKPGMGRAMLAWAEGKARTANRKFLRLDTEETDPGFKNYLYGLGYRDVDHTTHRARDLVLYEKDLTRHSA